MIRKQIRHNGNHDNTQLVSEETPGKSSPLVLWIDDDLSLLMLADRALNKSGFECVTALSGSEAIGLLDRIKPDIILLDVEMADMDGIETCRHLRNHANCLHTPILMVTGHDDLGSINQAYNAGATDILVKPINWKLLVYRIQYLLQTSHAVDVLSINKSRLRNAHKMIRDTKVLL
ncbi:MAG TPA: response regulator [Crenotrichaceae bacterium]|nr:response regulator [Crenotrichaceae bacterium]